VPVPRRDHLSAGPLVKYLVLTLITLCTALPVTAAPPSRVEMTFTITMGILELGEGREVLEHDGARYHVVSESIPRGLAALFIEDRRRESRGTVTANGLKPEHFEETGRKNGIRMAKFDWAAGKLTLVNAESTRTVKLPGDTLDQASLAYAFAFQSAARKVFDIHVTDGRRVKQYRYRQVGKETLETALGQMETLHIEKVRDPDDKRGFELWLAVDRHFLPVKLRYIEDNGNTFDSIVTGIKIQ
jgi:hypothetical protein